MAGRRSVFGWVLAGVAAGLAVGWAPPAAGAAEPPAGEVLKRRFAASRVFPGTVRDYWIYVPRQYDPAKPACVYVNQDGIQWDAPKVFDRLIAAKEMPVTIGVFVRPGVVPALGKEALDRFNRSFEYDGLGPAYARFLLEELLPEVERQTAADGRRLVLSKDGNDRAIGGSSSGAIAAFTAAWERPDGFARVFSAIGTYVGLRGGHGYSTLVRKFEPKPLRVFLQDGSNDLNIYGGDWWMANQALERSLAFAGYEVAHAWGAGGHDGKQGTQVFPDAMRFLWKDWPKPVAAGRGSAPLQDILLPGETWRLVGEGYGHAEGPAADPAGDVLFHDSPKRRLYRIPASADPFGKPAVDARWPDSRGGDGMAMDPRGDPVAATPDGLLNHASGKALKVGLRGNDLAIRADGGAYLTVPGKVLFVSPDGKSRQVDASAKFPNGVALSPDQSLLYVADFQSHWVWSHQVQPDGSLKHGQKYYHLHVPDTADDAGADGLRVDRDGRLYVATRMGIQVCDQAGRVNCIIPTPNGTVSNLCFGGKAFDVLYATCHDKVFARRVKVRGLAAFLPPVKPAAPRL